MMVDLWEGEMVLKWVDKLELESVELKAEYSDDCKVGLSVVQTVELLVVLSDALMDVMTGGRWAALSVV